MAGGSRYSRALWLLLLAALLVTESLARRAATASPLPQPVASVDSFRSLDDILRYISDDWTGLKRSLTDCNTYQDVKTQGKPTLYLPADISIPPALAQMQQRCHLQVEHLPANPSEEDAGKIQPHGLLYLENPYVVPGGQFNEMYGWDSYFIIRGCFATIIATSPREWSKTSSTKFSTMEACSTPTAPTTSAAPSRLFSAR